MANAYFQIPELRGFEKFSEGRMCEEMPRITPKICGVCPGAHHMASAKACDAVYGVTIPSAARKLRELLPPGLPLVVGGAAAPAYRTTLEAIEAAVLPDLTALRQALRERGAAATS